MTKKELADEIATKRGENAELVLKIVEDFMKVVSQHVAEGSSVYLRGFGVFTHVMRKEKKGRNITKGVQITIPSKRVPQFKAYPHFKKLVAKTK